MKRFEGFRSIMNEWKMLEIGSEYEALTIDIHIKFGIL